MIDGNVAPTRRRSLWWTSGLRTGRMVSLVRSAGPEPALWILALLFLAVIDPSKDSVITLCPLRIFGVPHCPGCGLGRSVSFLLHGEFAASLRCHLLGIPATLTLIYRIVTMINSVRTNNRSAYA